MALPPPPGGQPIYPGAPYPRIGATLNPGDILSAPAGFVTPNYDDIIAKAMAGWQALSQAQLGALGAQVGAQSDIAKANAALAQQQLDAQHKENIHNLDQNLAARGLYQSGEQPYQTGRENRSYTYATTTAANNLLAFLTQLQDQLVNAKLAALQEQQAQQQQLLTTIPAQYPATWRDAQPIMPTSRTW